MAKHTVLLLGTTKGAFLLRSDTARQAWAISGPHCDLWPLNHVIADPVSGMIWAAGGNDWFGAAVWRSADQGRTWACSRLSTGKIDAWLASDPGFAAEMGLSPADPAPFPGQIDALWSLCLSGGTLYAGAKPAALFASKDGGQSWEKVQGLSDHPSGDSWEPGGAGLTLHSIVADPSDDQKIWVGISAAGVFATEDGGKTWERRNRQLDEGASADLGACGHEVGHCVHHLEHAPGTGNRLYQQNHRGTFRSPDGGRTWVRISDGLPTQFGFPIAVHPRAPEMIWVLPLNGDIQGRFPPNASAAVWKSTDGGAHWVAKQKGLPAQNCFFTVLRQAMATDHATPLGLYFGTNSGAVFASLDEGESWAEIASHLPTILSVEVLETDQP
jgi:photosystem II stability/assembly factor-like uncharacterized protein